MKTKWRGIIFIIVLFTLSVTVTTFADEDGTGGSWTTNQNQKAYQNASGQLYKDCWVMVNGNRYRADNNGNILTGWQKIEDLFYYMNQDGVMQTGWLDVEGVWYYLKDDGIMHTGWLRHDDAWYHFSESGVMQIGWIEVADKWYFLKENGRMSIMNQTDGNSVYKFAQTGELSSVVIDNEIEYGSFPAFFLDDEAQVFMDALNEERLDNDKKSLILDYTLTQVAEHRLDGALNRGYYAQSKTVIGQGTLKSYLKEIDYYPNKGTLEVYLRGTDVDAAIESFMKSSDYTKLFNYSRAGVAVEEKNDRYYVMLVFMK